MVFMTLVEALINELQMLYSVLYGPIVMWSLLMKGHHKNMGLEHPRDI